MRWALNITGSGRLLKVETYNVHVIMHNSYMFINYRKELDSLKYILDLFQLYSQTPGLQCSGTCSMYVQHVHVHVAAVHVHVSKAVTVF